MMPPNVVRFVQLLCCVVSVFSLMGCGASYEVIAGASYLPSAEQVDAERVQLAMPAELEVRLNKAIEQSCSTAENVGSARMYMAQMPNPQELLQRRMLETLLRWAGEKPPDERLELQTRQLQSMPRMIVQKPSDNGQTPLLEHPVVQYGAGVVAGAAIGTVPLGPQVATIGIELKVLPKGTYHARVGKTCGEFVSGVVQIAAGCSGMAGGSGMSLTGGGTLVGIPLVAASFAVVVNGCLTVQHALNEAAAIWDEGPPSEPPSSQPSEVKLLEPKPKPTQPASPAKPTQPAPTETTTTTHYKDTGKTVTQKASGTTTTTRTKPSPAELKPYKQGGGHHVPAKRAFEGAPNYDLKKALAIPNAELKRLNIYHDKVVTPAQRKAYMDFATTGQPLTWEAIAKIETDVLVKSNMPPDMAKATVAKAIQALKDAGVAAPIRIPWGK